MKPCVKQFSTYDKFETIIDEILPGEILRMYEELPDPAKRLISLDFIKMQIKKQREDSGPTLYEQIQSFVPMFQSIMNRKFNELLGIFSLTEKPDNLLMWSHYADSHEGFVIGFDTTNPYFDQRKGPHDEFRYLRKVEYRYQRPQISLTELTGIEVFLVKSSDWAYEHEWRIIRAIPEADEVIPGKLYPIYLFRFPANAVIEVILGSRMSQDCRDAISHIVLKSGQFDNVRVLQAVPDEKEFRIVFQDLHI
jgi:hypothetical protein